MRFKKGSPEAKAHMARLRAMVGKRRVRKPLDLSGRHVYGDPRCACERCILGRKGAKPLGARTVRHVCDDDCRSFGCYKDRETRPDWARENPRRPYQYDPTKESADPKAHAKLLASGYKYIGNDGHYHLYQHPRTLKTRKVRFAPGGALGNPRRPKQDPVDAAIEQAYYRVASGVQVSILDIPKIYRDARAELSRGRTDIDQVLIDVVKRYQVAGHGGRILSNPPAFFIVDPWNNEILSIIRGHPAKTYPKSVEVAASDARRIGHGVVHVVHPHVPAGFKVGSVVSPMFYHYGANTVDAQGNVYKRNPKFKAKFTSAASDEVQEATLKAHGFRSALKKAERMTAKMDPKWSGPRSEVSVTRCNPRSCRNPGHRHARKNPMLQMVTLANPSSGAALKAKMVAFLKKWAKGIVEEDETTNFDREGAIYWFANDYHGGGGSALYQVLSMSEFRPGPSVSGPEKDSVEEMMYQALEQEFGPRREKKNPVPRGTRPSWMKTYCVMCGEWLKSKGPYHRMKVGPKKGEVICDHCYRGIRSGRRMGQSWAKNPPIPFKQGQIITVEQALAWARKTGNASLVRQCQEAIKLCKKANGPAQKVRFDLVGGGDPKKIESVMAGVEYGETDETVYKPTKGSKKGRHLYRHEWGEGSGKRKPVPLIATVDGKALVMPLGKGQKATDWLRG